MWQMNSTRLEWMNECTGSWGRSPFDPISRGPGTNMKWDSLMRVG